MTNMLSTSKLAIPMRKGLPALVDGAACSASAEMRRFTRVLRRTRTKMAGDWSDARRARMLAERVVSAKEVDLYRPDSGAADHTTFLQRLLRHGWGSVLR
jgi:hypothetical protein